MLITNGTITRNIEAVQLPEYKAKGYEVVKPATSKSAPKKAALKKAGVK